MAEHNCCAPSCSTSNCNKKIFYEFPKLGSKVRSNWEKFCNFTLAAENQELCNNHFADSCFAQDFSGKLASKLSANATPTIHAKGVNSKIANEKNSTINNSKFNKIAFIN